MSKFFRSPSSDSSGSCSSSDELSVDILPRPRIESTKQALTVAPTSTSSTTDAGTERTHLLLHALLEERCMLEARKDHPDHSVVDVEALAKAKYRHLSQQLTALGLTRDGLDHDRHESTRETYLSGLDMLMRNSIASSATGSLSTTAPFKRHLLEDVSRPESSPTNELARLQIDDRSWLQNSFLRSALGSVSSDPHLHPDSLSTNNIFERSRYFSDFQEIKLLGKGGYGAVFHVKNRIDDGHYAIKKIPLSHSYTEKIRRRGPQELDHLLREVRTLARLDHPNIVRYYAGWIEEAQFTGLRKSSVVSLSSNGSGGVEELSSVASAIGSYTEHKAASLRRVFTQSDSVEDDVVFQNSSSRSRPRATVSRTEKSTEALASSDGRFIAAPSDAAQPQESLPIVAKYPAQKNHGWSSTDSVTNPMDNDGLFETLGRVLTLCVQMSLHPFTLAEYLSTEAKTQSTHCYHLQASIEILVAILDGCEYLHQSGIVHRDLKPANILMGEKRHHNTTAGDLKTSRSCKTCRDTGNTSTIPLEIRIGDFGLVTTLAHPDLDESGGDRAVGTETYHPTHTSYNTGAVLDIFALGIIAFEILWTKEFSTRSERYDTINALKAGIFPHDFSRRTGDKTGCMEGCIRSMLSLKEDIRLASLRRRLMALRSDVMHRGEWLTSKARKGRVNFLLYVSAYTLWYSTYNGNRDRTQSCRYSHAKLRVSMDTTDTTER